MMCCFAGILLIEKDVKNETLQKNNIFLFNNEPGKLKHNLCCFGVMNLVYHQ